jgi:hypothetical protein
MDFDPHTGQHSFFIKDSIRTTKKTAIGIKNNKTQKGTPRENPNKDHIPSAFILSFSGIRTFFSDSHHAQKS